MLFNPSWLVISIFAIQQVQLVTAADVIVLGHPNNKYGYAILPEAVEHNGKIYVMKQELGKGANGIVGLYNTPQEIHNMAIKVISKPFRDYSSPMENPIKEEARFLRLNGLLIGKPVETNGRVIFAMKKAPGNTVFNELVKEKPSPEKINQMLDSMDKAIQKLEENGIEHRDLHLNNFLFDENTKTATIIDFGRASSTRLTDASGKPLQVHLNRDRIHMLELMNLVLKIIIPEDKMYEQVFNSINEKLNQAKKERNESLQKVDIKSLIQEKTLLKTKIDKKLFLRYNLSKDEIKSLAKQGKIVQRELNYLKRIEFLVQNKLEDVHQAEEISALLTLIGNLELARYHKILQPRTPLSLPVKIGLGAAGSVAVGSALTAAMKTNVDSKDPNSTN